MAPGELGYAKEVFTDLVAAWTLRLATPPTTEEGRALADKALSMAKALSAAQGATPSGVESKPNQAAEPTVDRFDRVATEWISRIVKRSAGSSKQRLLSQFRRYVFPSIGSRPIAAVTPQEILAVLRGIEAAGYPTLAYNTFKDLRFLYRFAIRAGLSDKDPTSTLRRAITKPPHKGMAAVLEPQSVGHLLTAIRAYTGKPRSTARYMLRLAPMLFLRPSELRTMEWAFVDLEAATIAIPAARMKTGRDHIVPLARQAVEVLRVVQKMTGQGRYVFTSGRGQDKPMDDGIFYSMLGVMGFRRTMTAHGFRTLAATWLNEHGFRQEVISRQLSHLGTDRTGRIYNRAEYLAERRKMMQAWADRLETLEYKARKAGADHAAA